MGYGYQSKSKDNIGIMTQNINGLGQFAENKKEPRDKKMISENRVDVMALQETNICWHKVINKHKICNMFRGWRENGEG